MKLLNEIFHSSEVPTRGWTVLREAVRGIVLDGRKLLMIYSERNGDYKFPGGGVERGENHEAALRREVAEETGRQVARIIEPFGRMIEYDLPLEKDYDLFKMTSYYYRCQVGGETGRQNLDQYEQELGFLPVWVEIDTAIDRNASLLADSNSLPRWVKRELQVLQKIRIAL